MSVIQVSLKSRPSPGPEVIKRLERRRESNPRRPAWEANNRLKIENLASNPVYPVKRI